MVLISFPVHISPLAIIHSSYIFLAWTPTVRNAVNLVHLWPARCRSRFMAGMFCTGVLGFDLSFLQTAVMLGSQTFVVLCACAILRWQLGTRWRYGLTSHMLLATPVLAWFGDADRQLTSMYLAARSLTSR
ncbi:MASE1 domain-containing protein [Shigella flexneri]